MGPRRVIAAAVAAASLLFAAPALAAVPDGGFISAPDGYYRIIGGAALKVGTCAALAGCPGAVPDSPSNYRTTPVNGSFIRVANGPAAGLIVRIAGSVPFGLSTCADFGGCPGTVELDHAGYEAYRLAHQDVASGTFIHVANGDLKTLVARSVGGVMIGLGTCAPLNNCAGMVSVDNISFKQYIARAREIPDGTYVREPAGGISRIVGGAALGIGTCAPLDNCPGYVDLDATAYRAVVTAKPNIADGRFVKVVSGPAAGTHARAAGGRLLAIPDCSALGGCPGAVEVDATAFSNYQNGHPFVAEGTVLRGVPSGTLWRIEPLGRRTTADGAGAIDVNDAVLAQFPNLDPAASRADADGDGVVSPQDCDDQHPGVRPGAPDAPGDGIDQDCSGADAAFARLETPIGAFFLTRSGRTRFTSLYVRDVPAGTTVTMRCQGRGCPFKSKVVRVKTARKRVSLLKHVQRARLRKGAQLEIAVTRPGTIGRVARIAFRAPKNPKRSNLCLPPGAARASACA